MPPSPVYGSEELAMLLRVLDESVKVVVESTVHCSVKMMQDLSSRLGKAIMDHFEAGETDPEAEDRHRERPAALFDLAGASRAGGWGNHPLREDPPPDFLDR